MNSLRSDYQYGQFKKGTDTSAMGYNLLNPAVSRTGTFAKGQSMDDAIQFATNNIQVNYKGGGVPAPDMDTNSNLVSAKEWRPRMRQELYPRAFATTPWMGMGSGSQEPDKESNLMFSHHSKNPKSVNTIEERTMTYFMAPLIPTKLAELNNSSNYIEEDGMNGLVRGGIPTRMMNIKQMR